MRNPLYDKIISEVAENLNLPKKFVDKVYRAYWKSIREYISSLPLKDDLSDEEFAKLKSSVNLPSIGKLYITPEKYRWYKNKFEYIKQLKENKNNNVTDNKD